MEIVTRSEGAVSCFSARGKVERADGCFLVSYIKDGDAVALDARERSLLMQRTGDCSLRVEFLLGRRSVMTVSGGAKFPFLLPFILFAVRKTVSFVD